MDFMKKIIKNWVLPILIAVVIAIGINHFLFFKMNVISGSMSPTIKIGDNIFATRIYNFNRIKRGDILVFYSEEIGATLTKRVIGLPGDEIKINEDGSIIINNKLQKEPYVKNMGGLTGNYKVPEGKYFFLGDNRANSFDSRYWKNTYISRSFIRGKAQITVYPFNRIGFTKK